MIKLLLLFLFLIGCKKQPNESAQRIYVDVKFPTCEEDTLFCDDFEDLPEKEDENKEEQK